MIEIASWGRLSHQKYNTAILSSFSDVFHTIKHHLPGISYGMGRSYGDQALSSNNSLWLTKDLNRFKHFDPQTGILICEAGLSLQEVQRVFAPQGWILPVTPGTQIVSIGGAIANDVHGKNHHKFGSFGDHILHIKLLRTDGSIIECSRSQNSDFFFATIGGIGLTGIIVEATIQLRSITSPWIESENIAYTNLDEFFKLSDSSEQNWEHIVSWIDCMNGSEPRGIFIRGNFLQQPYNHSLPNIKEKKFPFTPPISLVNKISLPIFNYGYFQKNSRKASREINYYETFSYPLDAVHDWNKMYGPKGFYQYQCVIPRNIGSDVIKEILRVIKKSKQGSFLAVLKTFGTHESGGLLSFPKNGVTLALDFPNHEQETLSLFHQLDQIVGEASGRIYLAKDSRMPRWLFEIGYPNFQTFLKFKDPNISSDMSRRLLGT